MATVTRIEMHVSSNGWADGCDMDGVDEVASFEAYLDNLEESYQRAYPGARIEVTSRPGDLKNTFHLYAGDEWIDTNDDEYLVAEDVGSAVWQAGDFWRMTGHTGTRTLRWATILHGVTGQEIEDVENIAARPATDSEIARWERNGSLRQAGTRSVYATENNLIAVSRQGYDETAEQAEARNEADIRAALGR